MVFKLLFEQAEVIIQSDPVSGQSECCDRIKKTCRQSPKPSVSKRWLRLNLLDLTYIFSVLKEHFFYFIINTEIDHIV